MKAGTAMLPGGGPPAAASRPAGFERLRRRGAGAAAPGTDLLPEARKARRTAEGAAGGLQAHPGAGMPEMPFKGAVVEPESGMDGAAQTVKGIAKKAPPAAPEAAGLPEDAAGAGRTPDGYAPPKGARKPETDPAGFGPTGHSYTGPSAIGPADCGETGRPPDGVPACRHGPRSKKAALPAMAGAGYPGRAPGAFGGFGAAALAAFKGGAAVPAAPMRRRLRRTDESGTGLRGGEPPRPARAPMPSSGTHGPRELAP